MHFTTYIIQKLADLMFCGLWYDKTEAQTPPLNDVDIVPKHHIRAHSSKKIFLGGKIVLLTLFFMKYLSVEISLIKCEVQIRISFQDLSIQALIIQDIHVHALVQSVLC